MSSLFNNDEPFDPSKMKAAAKAPPPPAPPSAPDRPYTVSQLNTAIAHALQANFPANVRVEGEVSGLKRQTHAYFTLKDTDAVLSCVMFAPALRKLSAPFEDGLRVVASGRIDHWPKGGRTQLYVESVTPVGKGALEAQLRALIQEARQLGWLDPERKRPLPAFPRALAVITSRTGAALQDVIDTARRRCPAVDLYVIDTRVQGDTAPPQITQRIKAITQLRRQRPIDAVILTRGGGSIEDLWAFNDRAVAEAILRCPVPVVAAIGHETDTTLAELVADERAATPTQAAMRLTPDRAALAEQTDALGARLSSALTRAARAERTRIQHHRRALHAAVRHNLANRRRALDALAQRLAHHRPDAVYERRAARLAEAHRRLRRALHARLAEQPHRAAALDLADAMNQRLAGAKQSHDALARELVLASPMHVLQRGYSMTRLTTGQIVRNPDQLTPGDTIETVLAEGTARSTVNEPGTDTPPPAEPRPAASLPKRTKPTTAPSRRRRKHNDDNQMGLF